MRSIELRAFAVSLFCLFSIPPFLSAEDIRTIPLDMRLILDGSEAISAGREQAIGWLCDYVVDDVLREGDRVSVWVAAGRSRQIFSASVSDPGVKETIKNLFRSIPLTKDPPDFAGALREAAGTNAGAGWISYTLLISGSRADYPTLPGSAGNLLRYSRVQEFPGWRAITAAPDIGPRVREAASAYMR
jgi:hypothetical protein